MVRFAHRPSELEETAMPRGPSAFGFLGDDDQMSAPAVAAPAAPTPAMAAPPDYRALLPWLDLDILHPAPAVPKPDQGDLVARANRGQAEKLLTTGDLRTPETAKRALDLLIAVPEANRGQAIDQMSDKAFAALCDQVPHDKREEFSKLLGGMSNPKRKLALWAESHKSHALNDAGRLKGDVGYDDDKTEDKLAELTRDPNVEEEEEDEEEDEVKRPKRTKDQKRNLARHKQRVASIVSTHGEVDSDKAKLLAKGKNLSLDDVDALIGRKDLEYSIERQHNVNLTSDKLELKDQTYAGGVWSKPELEQVKATLERLPDEHAHGTDSFKTINRLASPYMDLTQGLHAEDTIHMFDAANMKLAANSGDRREGVSPEFWVEHGDAINPFELALTHEIGHDVGDKHAAAFEAFKKAGGWHAVDAKDLRADGVKDEDIDTVRKSKQTTTNLPPAESEDSYYTRNVHDKNHEFWAQDKTATPTPLETSAEQKRKPESVSDERGRETWNYAKSNPAEHFAEVYTKAVHVPDKLHADLVRLPQEAAKAAHATLEAKERALQQLDGKKRKDPLKVAALKKEIEDAQKEVARSEKAVEQRHEQFRIMREDVFHTDKAAAQSRSRLQFMNVDAKKLAAFDERAARLSTPEQIAALEEELRS